MIHWHRILLYKAFLPHLSRMSSILSLTESDQSRTKKEGPLELYLWPNDPERTTITTDTGLPEYQISTKEGQLFGSGRVSSFQKLVDSDNGGVAVWVSYCLQCYHEDILCLLSMMVSL